MKPKGFVRPSCQLFVTFDLARLKFLYGLVSESVGPQAHTPGTDTHGLGILFLLDLGRVLPIVDPFLRTGSRSMWKIDVGCYCPYMPPSLSYGNSARHCVLFIPMSTGIVPSVQVQPDLCPSDCAVLTRVMKHWHCHISFACARAASCRLPLSMFPTGKQTMLVCIHSVEHRRHVVSCKQIISVQSVSSCQGRSGRYTVIERAL